MITTDNRHRRNKRLFTRQQTVLRFGLITISTAASLVLLASACSSTGDDTGGTAAVPAVTIPVTTPAEPAPATSSESSTLPTRVPETVAEFPTFPIPVPPEPSAPTTTVSPDIYIPETTLPSDLTPLPGAPDDAGSTEALPGTPGAGIIEPIPGVIGYEFTTIGENDITFFVKLGDTHPLSFCFSFAEGNPRVSSLPASTIDEAKTVLAEIGNGCAVSKQDYEFDVTDVAVGCVDAAGEISDVCAPVGLPDFSVQPELVAPSETTSPSPSPPVTTSPPTTTTVPPQVPVGPSLAGLTPEEVVVTRLELLHTYPLPVEGAGIGGFPTDEDFYNWESVVYSHLLEISKVGPQTSISPREPINGVFVRTTDQPEFLIMLERYEDFMRLGGYTFFNTCASARFPQVTSESSMLDFIHRDSEAVTTRSVGSTTGMVSRTSGARWT